MGWAASVGRHHYPKRFKPDRATLGRPFLRKNERRATRAAMHNVI